MKPSQRAGWKKTHIANRLMVWMTSIVAAATLWLAVAAIFQYLTAREQSRAATEQARAASEQVNAMRGQLDTMKDQANSMREQTNALKESLGLTNRAVGAAEKQANTSQVAARAAEISAKATEKNAQMAQETLRPVIDARVMMIGLTADQIDFNLILRNEGGKASEFTLSHCMMVDTLSRVHTIHDCKPVIVKGPFAAIPHTDFPFAIRVEQRVREVRAREIYLFMPVTVSYYDFGTKRSVPFCFVWREHFKGFGDCSDLQQEENQNPKK